MSKGEVQRVIFLLREIYFEYRSRLGECHFAPLSLLSPNKKPSDPVASRALRATRRAVTRASRAFLPISLIQRADNDGPTCFPVRRLAAELIDAQGAVDWRAAFGAPSHWFLSSAHARSLLRRFATG
jgi:hypothetical protein